MKTEEFDPVIRAALKEDIPEGDITSESIIPAASRSEALFLPREEGVLAGIDVAKRVFELIDPQVSFEMEFRDGQSFQKGTVLAKVRGASVSLLKGERTALNFLQRLSGIATTTKRFVEAIAGTQAKILDTRKTTPGLRILEKYAVRMGGGQNHRLNLSEMVMIKDNHLLLVKSIKNAVSKAREQLGSGIKIEVEVTSLEQAQEAVRAGADMIMLDNMPLARMKEVVDWLEKKVPVEVSGAVRLEDIREIALLGVDFISVGSLTHSYKSVDIALEFLSR